MITPVLSSMASPSSSSQQLCRFCNNKQATVHGFWCQSCFDNPPKTCTFCSAKHQTALCLCRNCKINPPKTCVYCSKKNAIAEFYLCQQCFQNLPDMCVSCNKLIKTGKLACSDENCKLYASYLVQTGVLCSGYDLS